MQKLAIVIPAYKKIYFEQTLASIANQTCKDFTLYIGNDSGPDELELIANSFKGQIEIKYTFFDKNLGGNNLVNQWERCIDLIENEEWIWLFSDDDIMEPDCVENFFRTLNKYPNFDLYHFNILRIDGQNEIIRNCFLFPDIYLVEDYLIDRLNGKASSYAVEYIFRKEHFLKNNRFINFDLAWGSDDATWIKIGKKNGIKTISDSKVHWRESPYNISPNNKDTTLLKRKLLAQIQFAKWVNNHAENNPIQLNRNFLKKHLEFWFLESIKSNSNHFSLAEVKKILTSFYQVLEQQKPPINILVQICYNKIYSGLKLTLKKLFFIKPDPKFKQRKISNNLSGV